MRRVVAFLVWLLLAGPALASCPNTITDCPSPTFDLMTSNRATTGTLSATTGTIGTLNSSIGTITTLNSTAGTFSTLAADCNVTAISRVAASCMMPAVGAAAANQAAGLPAGDCVTDDTLGVNTFLAAHPNTTIVVPAACYRMVSGDLVLPFGVELVGTGNSYYWMRRYDAWQTTSTFMFDGAHSFVPFLAPYFHNIAVVRDGAQTACPAGAKFAGIISDGSGSAGTILNVATVTNGTIHVGDLLGGPNIPAPSVTIVSFGTGTGGIGTYNINQPLLVDTPIFATGVTSETMTTGPVPSTPMCGDPTDGQIQYMAAGWGTDGSTGIYMASGVGLQTLNQRNTAQGFALDHIFIGGFFRPLDVETGIGTIRDVFIDGYNGAYFGPSGANTLMENIQVNRWLCSASANCQGGRSEFRGGTGFYFDQASIHLHNSFSHNYNQGLVIANVNGGFWNNVAGEFQNFDAVHTGSIGVRIFGSTGGRFGGEFTNFLSFVQPYQFEASDTPPLPNAFVWDRPNFVQPSRLVDDTDTRPLNPAVSSYAYLGGDTSGPPVLSFGGAPVVGSTISLAIDVSVPATTSATTPFGPVTAVTSATTNPALKTGYVLTFAAVPAGSLPGMSVTDTTQPTAYPAGTIIVAATATTLTTSALPTVTVGLGDTISVALDNKTIAIAPTATGLYTPPGVIMGSTVTDGTTGGVIPGGTKVASRTNYNVTLDTAVTGGGIQAADAVAFAESMNFTYAATNQDISYNANSANRLAAIARGLGYVINIDPTMGMLRCHAESVRKPNSLNIYCPLADTLTVVQSSTGGITSQYNYDVQTNAGTAAGNFTLSFVGPLDEGIQKNDLVIDVTNPSAIPAGTMVASVTTNSVTLDTAVAGGGVLSGDHIQFPGAPEHGTSALLYNAVVSNNLTEIPVFLQDGGASSNVMINGISANQGFWSRWIMGATQASMINIYNRLLTLPPTVSGTGCTLVEGTDEKGLVTETAASTGCTLTFRSAFPWQPVAELLGPGVTGITTAANGSSMTWTTISPSTTSYFRYKVDFE